MSLTRYRLPRERYIDSTVIKLLLFIIWPFGAFVLSLFRPASKSSYVIYWLFGILFCWSMYINDGDTFIDFINITHRFYNQSQMTFDELIERITNIYAENSKDKDIYNITLNWLVQQFSSNFHTLFALASIPYLYFMLKSLKMVTGDNIRFSTSFWCYVIILLFVLPKSIFDVQNFRFSTATWVSTYGFLQFFYLGRKKYCLLLLVTPFIHSSYWFIVIIAALYLLFRRIPMRYAYYVSLPFAIIATNILSSMDLSFLPASLATWGDNYLSEKAYKEWGMGRTGTGLYWIAQLFEIFHILTYAAAIIIMMNSSELKNADVGTKRLFGFQLFSLTIINFVQIIPVLGSRFLLNSYILTIFLWYKLKYPKNNIMLLLILAGWTYEIIYYTIPHYNLVTSSDFFVQNLFSLIAKYWGVISY